MRLFTLFKSIENETCWMICLKEDMPYFNGIYVSMMKNGPCRKSRNAVPCPNTVCCSSLFFQNPFKMKYVARFVLTKIYIALIAVMSIWWKTFLQQLCPSFTTNLSALSYKLFRMKTVLYEGYNDSSLYS